LDISSAAELACKEVHDLSILDGLNGEMRDIAFRLRNRKTMPPMTDISSFVNLDIGFHASISFLSGMYFAEEGTIHARRRIAKIQRPAFEKRGRDRTIEQMLQTVDEHHRIVNAMRAGRDGRVEVINLMKDHIKSAFDFTSVLQPHEAKDFATIADIVAAWILKRSQK
jgi:DNA-binding GntR family transcriptional regulator